MKYDRILKVPDGDTLYQTYELTDADVTPPLEFASIAGFTYPNVNIKVSAVSCDRKTDERQLELQLTAAWPTSRVVNFENQSPTIYCRAQNDCVVLYGVTGLPRAIVLYPYSPQTLNLKFERMLVQNWTDYKSNSGNRS